MYAGFWKRFAAFILDTLIIYAVFVPVAVILVIMMPSAMVETEELNLASIFMNLVFFLGGTIAPLLYFAFFESGPRQATPGKMALNIIVCDEAGNRLTFWHAMGRNVAKWVTNFTFYIGYMMAGFTVRKQALHDKIAGTLVVTQDADAHNMQPLPPTPVWKMILYCALVLVPFMLLFVLIFALAIYVGFQAAAKERQNAAPGAAQPAAITAPFVPGAH